LVALKAALAEGLPVAIGIQLYESFESEAAARTGKIPMLKRTKERVLGGHAMLVVGGYSSYNEDIALAIKRLRYVVPGFFFFGKGDLTASCTDTT
jgi:hypothetical protein